MTAQVDRSPKGGDAQRLHAQHESAVPSGMRTYGSYKDILKPHPAFPLPFAHRTPLRIRKDAA
jgi:hypothetical protein